MQDPKFIVTYREAGSAITRQTVIDSPSDAPIGAQDAQGQVRRNVPGCEVLGCVMINSGPASPAPEERSEDDDGPSPSAVASRATKRRIKAKVEERLSEDV